MSESQEDTQRSVSPLLSELSDDPDMAELVMFFLTELELRIREMEEAYEADDRQRLQRIAHQLKGAAGGYGYPTITYSAGDLEKAVLAEQAELSAIAEKLESLIDLCRRAQAAV